MPEPVVTTVLTTFKNPGLLRRAIESVLGQTYPGLRLAVYDDASGDDTGSVVRSYAARDDRVAYQAHPSNLGLVRNFAFGLDQVSTPYLSFLSDDDWLLPELYAIAIPQLEAQPEAAFLSTRVVHVDDDGYVLRQADITAGPPALHRPPGGLLALLEHGAPTWTGTVFRTAAAKAIGGLDRRTGDVIDVDLVLRLAARHPFLVDPRYGAVFSRRRDSVSGRLRLSSTWPGWPVMIENLRQAPSLPAEVRANAEAVLTAQLVGRLYGTGLAAARRGDSDEALQAARILADRYGRTREARTVRSVDTVCRRLPALGAVLPRLGRRRLPYLRAGPLRSRISLDEHLAGRHIEQDTAADDR